MRVRTYSPSSGRFHQRDPFSGKQGSGATLYVYCANDPVNSADPTGLYGLDVHRYLSEYLAFHAGFSAAQSAQIGLFALRPDTDGRGAGFGLTHGNNNTDWHFPSDTRMTDLAGRIQGWGDPEAFVRAVGDFLHPQEDSYAHSTGEDNRNWTYYGNWGLFESGGLIGHGWQGHYPDFTWWRPQKSMRMAERVFADLRHLFLTRGHYDDDPGLSTLNGAAQLGDDEMRNTVRLFLEFPDPPNRPGGAARVTETFSGFNLTRQSMVNKIRILVPGFSVREDLDDTPDEFLSDEEIEFKHMPNVEGHRFGTYRPVVIPKQAQIQMYGIQ